MRPFYLRRRIPSWTGLTAVAALGVTALACGKSESATGLPPADGGLPDGGGGAGTTKEMTLLLTGKVGGSLEPCG